ncbi:hypothetical protein BC833DRAFT_603588 [Globomyces pollinis-pini]|nr:hypothetical protein BC833DRAFT_603588 [Globomyces pollinis-pini]
MGNNISIKTSPEHHGMERHASKSRPEQLKNSKILKEIQRLSAAFEKSQDGSGTINKEQFKSVLSANVDAWSKGAQLLFLERLFDAFDMDRSGSIDYNEFLRGLKIFFQGSEDEKCELTFRIYDVDKSGDIQPKELIHIMAEMYSSYHGTDQMGSVATLVHQIFHDLDINGDGSLSITEFRLMAVKEPMMIDFIEEFLRIPE